MNPCTATLLDRLFGAGLHCWYDGDVLHVGPQRLLSQELCALIRAHREDILDELSGLFAPKPLPLDQARRRRDERHPAVRRVDGFEAREAAGLALFPPVDLGAVLARMPDATPHGQHVLEPVEPT